jgi:pseudouridine kinase
MPIVPLKKPRSKTRIVVVGGANMDIAGHTRTLLAPEDSTPGEIACSPGGVARNVAENLARLGADFGIDVHLVSAVGDDVFGHRLMEATRAAGVNVDAVAVLPSQRTAAYLSLHGPDGDMAFGVNDMGILDYLTPQFLQRHADRICSADLLVLDCNLTPPALEWLVQESSGVPVFADGVSVVKCAKLLPWLARLHTFKVNRLEAQALTGQRVQSADDARLAALRLHQMGAANVVLTMGEQGAAWCDQQGETGHRAAATVAVVNTSGAGDALLAGLVHAHLNHLPLAQAVAFGMACAEITLASPFANAPELSRLGIT